MQREGLNLSPAQACRARRLAKRPSLGSRRGGAAPAPAPEAAALGLPPPGPSPAAAQPGSWRPPLPPPRGTGPSRAAAAASSPVLLLLGEEDEDEEGAGRRRRARGRLAEKPRGGAEEDDDDEREDEEVVVEVVDGDEDDEDAEERFVPLGPGRALPKGPARGAAKVGSFKREMTFTFQPEDLRRESSKKTSHHLFPLAMEEDVKAADTKKASRILEQEKENTRSICLLEQKRKVVSSNIDVPPARKSSEELDMDKVTAAMVLTSLSTSPLVRSPPVRPNESLSGSWKEGAPSSSSSSGYWSWSAPSDQSNPSTPSPPLSADSFKPFRSPAPPDDGIDEAEASNLLFDEPIPRKRKNSMKVMFKCLWKNCGKVLNTAAGIQKHIRAIHLGRVGDSDYSDGEEDFYYTEIKLNTDSMSEGLSGLAPVSPSQSLTSPPTFPVPDCSRTEAPCAKTDPKPMTPLSRSAPTTLYLVHTDHAYQATPPVTIPGSKFTPNGSSFSISWQSPPVTFTGIPVSPTHHHPVGSGEQRQHAHTVLSSPPRGTVSLRKPRGEGKKCRKVYGMENRDMWCTACRWKKACQRFID
ncbi:LOW QUALITY PROTEIN: zinc finger protein 704 [Arvicola amphibius]|uniref:LOW QUALITY PROTEIN: zinc finger protein 704 n=1 Tax=Arvicola amphibius TaxID=1047088 RepID=UPI001C0935F9|nr:LOW QUALITY PROTEIN: zinc finger protein 704 [Arvicola amphibius]